MKRLPIFVLFLFALNILNAQSLLKGKVVDQLSMKPLANAQITVEGQMNGGLSNPEGVFEVEISDFPALLHISFIGYESKSIMITEPNRELVVVSLRTKAFQLSEVHVTVNNARERHSPVSFSTVAASQIETQLGDRPMPEIAQFTPGIYASRDGGGSGDATISIRGFQQENIAVLLNGVPINGAENGLVYWNNWIGLTEATASVQLQRGIGASKVALNSVGGTINIVTKQSDQTQGASFSYQLTNYGNTKTSFGYRTGVHDGWSLSFMGSRTKGDGYVDGTYVDAWAYYVDLQKTINTKHALQFTALGGPEKHGQRSLKMSKSEIDLYGIKHNKEWGSYNGQMNNASENFYHKPHLALNHYWQTSEQATLTTSAYFTPGWGGGKWQDSFQYGPGIFDFRNPSGQIDWDAIYNYNANNSAQYTLDNGNTVSGFSNLVQTHFLASHVWAGLISFYDWQINPTTKLSTGVHYKYFKSRLQQKVNDLLGGQFYIDDFSWSLAGVANREQIKMPGDVIRINNGAILHNSSLFVQIEKSFGLLNAFVGGTISNARYQRFDPYNYPTDIYSDRVARNGNDLKAGINYNLNENHNFYLNGGYFSKTPYYKYVFGNFSNVPVKDIGNEMVTTAEIGYGYKRNGHSLHVNAYSTLWKDVSFLSNEYIQLENNSQTRAMVNGLDALHNGLEIETSIKLHKSITIGGLLSAGDWKWKNDVSARLFNDSNIVVDTVMVFADGLKVGGHPQFQAGLFTQIQTKNNFQFKAEWQFFDKRYASFDPANRHDRDDRAHAYRLPSFQQMNLYLQIPINFNKAEGLIFAGCYNLFDETYILKGEDGSQHNLDTFRGFWSFGRTFSFGINVKI